MYAAPEYTPHFLMLHDTFTQKDSTHTILFSFDLRLAVFLKICLDISSMASTQQ